MSAPRRTAAVRVLDVVLLAAAGALLVTRLHLTTALDMRDEVIALALAAAFFVADAYPLHLESRGQTYTMSLSELPLVLGLLFGRPELLVAARLLGGGLSLGLRRRQPLEKLAFNLSAYAFEVTLAATVFLALPAHAHAVPDGWALAVVLATSAAAASTTVAVAFVIRLHVGRWDLEALRVFAVECAQTVLVNCCAGLLIAGALRHSPVAAFPVLVVTAALYAAYRSHVDLRHRYANLALIYDFTTSIDQGSSYERRLQDLLARTRDVLRSGHSEVVVLTDGQTVRHRLDEHGQLRSDTRARTATDMPLEAVVATGLPLRVGRGVRVAGVSPLLVARGWRDCLLVPMTLDGGATGVLAVANRLSDVSTFTEDEERLLSSVGTQVAAALVNGQLLDRLTHDSRHDGLTGLANRTTFQDRLRAAADADGHLAVLLMDLDRFKEVNDTLGHHHGDLLICEVAARLRGATPASATVARLGGDEFAVLLPGSDAAHARQVAASVWAAVAQPCWIEGVALDVQSSIGIAVCPDHGIDTTVLLKRADTAMYAAKRTGSGIELYDSGRDEHSPRRLALASQMRTAAGDGDLLLEYQPQIDIPTGRVVGVEALMRWRHPDLGMVSPGEFIPVAEQSGAIATLSHWALTEAVAQAARWRDDGLDLEVSVNLSMRNLTDGAMSDHLGLLLREHHLDPRLVTLEVTESQVMADPQRTLRILEAIARLGVGLSIDDFGTGYSSLAYLRQLPVDEIKIDRSFMTGLAMGEQEAAIVRAVIDLSRSLSLRVVAEGVEDAPTLRRLAGLGCGRAQGFLFSRSLPAGDVAAWIEAQQPSLQASAAAAARGPEERRRLAVVPAQRSPRVSARLG